MDELHIESSGAEPAFEGYVRHRATVQGSDVRHDLFWLSPEDAHPIDDSWLVVPALLFGMVRGEAVHLHGRISPALHARLDDVQRTMAEKCPLYRPVPFQVDEVSPPSEAPGRETLACFSLGVDTFFTAVHHRDEIDALYYLHGFEALQSDDLHLHLVLPRLRAAAAELGLPLRLIATNALDELVPYGQNTAVSSIPMATASAALMGSRYGRVLQSATHDQPYNEAISLTLDEYMSLFDTEAFETSVRGGVSRIDKLRRLKEQPAAMRWLRVCWYGRGLYNCGRCTKCVRTMVNLDLAGAAGRCRTFPARIDLRRLADVRFPEDSLASDLGYVRENLDEARAQGKAELVRALEASLEQNAPPPPIWTWPLRRLGSIRRRWGRSWAKREAKRSLARRRRMYPGRHLFETVEPNAD